MKGVCGRPLREKVSFCLFVSSASAFMAECFQVFSVAQGGLILRECDLPALVRGVARTIYRFVLLGSTLPRLLGCAWKALSKCLGSKCAST